MSLLLAIETSCDESAVAVIDDSSGRPLVVDTVISSQIDIHRQYGGVVPEVASRNHSINLPEIVKMLMKRIEYEMDDFSGFAATGGPGLASSLLIGHAMAKGFAVATGKPFYSINHMEGHLLSPFLPSGRSDVPPHLALVVSGGHTMLVDVRGLGQYRIVARTIDDAVGEAFDKVARMLGLPYPGGPEIERRAMDGDVRAFNFPRSLPSKDDFSFSGLKTAVLYTLQKAGFMQGHLPEAEMLNDYCASFQQAVIDSLVKKSLRQVENGSYDLMTISGGVSCNQAIVTALQLRLAQTACEFLPCERQYTTDNAAMIGYTAWLYHQQGKASSLRENINPNLALA